MTEGDRCTVVLLGATGDLARKKLLSAVVDLRKKGLIPDDCRIVGVDRVPMDDFAFRDLVEDVVANGDAHDVAPEELNRLLARTTYVHGDLTTPGLYAGLAAHLDAVERDVPLETRNRLFYFAVPPQVFEPALDQLVTSGLLQRKTAEERPWARAIIEKPFGRCLSTAASLDRKVRSSIDEHQIFRIDHYLGKETVQNLLVFRAANAMFEPIWNRDHISHVQITAAETLGVENRGGYYDTAGATRDMFQNHLFQLLALTAMELPTSLRANDVRDEKVKLLRSVAAIDSARVVRAQYGTGATSTAILRGYTEEGGVGAGTRTETYAAMELGVDNGRWRGVPFFLRSGKRMAARTTEIAVFFKQPPYMLEGIAGGSREAAGNDTSSGNVRANNVLVLRVQPHEGMSLTFATKVPGVSRALDPELSIAPVDMRFDYADAFGAEPHAAYETLLLDATIGDATRFLRSDEVATSWRLLDPLLQAWEGDTQSPIASYPAGSWGPAEADALIARRGFAWRTPSDS